MSRTVRFLLMLLLATAPFTVTACSSDPAATSSETAAQVQVVDAAEARSLIDDGAGVIDVRTPEEFATGHLRGATNIDVQAADFHQRVGELDKGASYVLYCRSGSRAGAAADMMLDMGFTDVVNAGGYDTLAAAGLPSE
jgi:phage shock protein E